MRRFALLACLAALSCSKSPAEDPNACKQTYGFGNYGCADVTGSVVSVSNVPLGNVEITGGNINDPYEHFETSSTAGGQFTVRLLRRWIPPQDHPDTVTTWVHTVVPASGGQPAVEDSSQIQVQFYRFGQRPTAVAVTLHTSLP